MGCVLGITPQKVVFIDHSGTITMGGTAQTVANYRTDRVYLLIQNLSHTESLWVNFTIDAAMSQPSIELLPMGSLEMENSIVSVESVSLIAATTGHPYICKEAI